MQKADKYAAYWVNICNISAYYLYIHFCNKFQLVSHAWCELFTILFRRLHNKSALRSKLKWSERSKPEDRRYSCYILQGFLVFYYFLCMWKAGDYSQPKDIGLSWAKPFTTTTAANHSFQDKYYCFACKEIVAVNHNSTWISEIFNHACSFA